MTQTFNIEGHWEYHKLDQYIKQIEHFFEQTKNDPKVIFDFTNAKEIDSSGIVLIIKFLTLYKRKNINVEIQNITEKHQDMLDLYNENYVHVDIINENETTSNKLQDLGKNVLKTSENFMHFTYFTGRLFSMFFYLLLHPSQIRFKALINQMDIAAIQILPIIALALFLVGFVTAYQGADQLNNFGAAIIVIEMSTMSMFREIAPFLAAVIVAGRSASSYTAQIATMKISEEISAMRTMGLDVDIFLILPRVLALIFVMPLLVFFADMASLAGEMVIVKYHLGISYSQFLDRIYEYVEIRHIMLGLLKAPLFGLLIAIIGCYRGLQVRSGTDIGKYTTKAVVDSIFWLIIVNAMISLLSIELGF